MTQTKITVNGTVPIVLMQASQLDEIQRTYSGNELTSVEVERIRDVRTLKGIVHYYIMKKHFDGLKDFIDFARRHYIV